MAKTYWEKLQDPRWQRKRLEILQRDEFTCLKCGSTKDTLHVHHGYYERNTEPWEYPDDSLHTLCECCHSQVGDCLRDIGASAGKMSPGLLEAALYLLEWLKRDAGNDVDTIGKMHLYSMCEVGNLECIKEVLQMLLANSPLDDPAAIYDLFVSETDSCLARRNKHRQGSRETIQR